MKNSVKPADSRNIPALSFTAVLDKLLEDNGVLMAAGLAFFSLFALAPSLIIVVAISGLALGKIAAETQVLQHIQSMLGGEVAELLRGLIHNVHYSGPRKTTILSLLFLAAGATGLFVQLKAALNHVWRADVRATPRRGGLIRKHLKTRMSGLLFVAAAGALLLLYFSANAVAWMFYRHAAPLMPLLDGRSFWLFRLMNLGLAFCGLTVFSAMIFRYLPDAKMRWRDAWRGALMTAALLMLGLFLVASFLGQANFRSVFGVAASVVGLLIWVYVSALIFLFGAEATWFLNQKTMAGTEEDALAAPQGNR